MNTEIMIDIETLGVPEDLPAGYRVEVVEIGVVKFRDGQPLDHGLLLFPRVGNGLCCASTAAWWMKQAVKRGELPAWARERLEAERFETLPDMGSCLEMVRDYIGGYDMPVWSKGAFDLPILKQHFAACQLVLPWQYWNERDLRTMVKEARLDDRGRATHTALEDARVQVRLLNEARAALGGRAA